MSTTINLLAFLEYRCRRDTAAVNVRHGSVVIERALNRSARARIYCGRWEERMPAPVTRVPAATPPVEYAAAVDRYLAQAALGPASRRVYRISLAGWAWPLVGKRTPQGTGRRRAVPPIVPLALLDDAATGPRLARSE